MKKLNFMAASIFIIIFVATGYSQTFSIKDSSGYFFLAGDTAGVTGDGFAPYAYFVEARFYEYDANNYLIDSSYALSLATALVDGGGKLTGFLVRDHSDAPNPNAQSVQLALISGGAQPSYFYSQNILPLQMTNIAAQLPAVRFGSCIWGDYDTDRDLDIFIMGLQDNGSIRSALFRNDNGTFNNSELLFQSLNYGQAAWGDYNNDNLPDLAITGDSTSSHLSAKIYRNTGAGLAEIPVGLTGVSNGAALSWVDYDNDGDLDLIITGDTGLGYVLNLYRNDGGDIFTLLNPGITAVRAASMDWADYDNDGDPDLLLTGEDISVNGRTLIYINNAGTFTEFDPGLPGVIWGGGRWGDYDNDGDADILLSGHASLLATNITRLYRNDGENIFTEIPAAGLTSLYWGSAAWGDYDSDGLLDILLTGMDNASNNRTIIFHNNGGDVFENIGEPLLNMSQGQAAFGDYDNDGDLDILACGSYTSAVYRNNSLNKNIPPGLPYNITATYSAGNLNLNWNPAYDYSTPNTALTYNLRIGSTPGASDILSPMAIPADGYRQIPAPGNAGQRLGWTLRNAKPGAYYIAVQAIDNGFMGSNFSPETSYITGSVSGTIAHDTTWSDTVKVTGDIYIKDGVTLQIKPGTVVVFKGWFGVAVQGRLLSIGAPDSLIHFTVDDTSGFYDFNNTNGSWAGINFNDTPVSNDSSIISYSLLEFAKAVEYYGDYYGGAIFCRNELYTGVKLKIDHSIFVNNHAYYGGAIACETYAGNPFAAKPQFNKNKFKNNSANYGGAVWLSFSDASLRHNIFAENSADMGGAVYITGNGSPLFSRNTMVDNRAMNGSSNQGGAVYCSNTWWSVRFDNNTIVRNQAWNGGGIYMDYQGQPSLLNNIIRGNLSVYNGSQVYLNFTGAVQQMFSYNNIEGGLDGFGFGSAFGGTYDTTNIDFPANFLNEAVNDFHLGYNSPCIDMGDPAYTVPDSGGQRIDIGALEYTGDTVEKAVWGTGIYQFGRSNVELDITSSTLSKVTVTIVDNPHPNNRPYLIDRYFTITPDGYLTADLKYVINPSDTAGRGWGNKLALYRWNGVDWENHGGTLTNNSLVVRDISAFSDWTLGNDNTIPAPKKIFAVSGNGQVELHWEAVKMPDFRYYRIYADENMSPVALRGQTTEGDTNHTHFVVGGLQNNHLYYFAVRAVSMSGAESEISPVDAAVPVVEQGNAAYFDGEDDFIDFPANLNLNPDSSITLQAWIYPNSPMGGRIISKWGSSSGYELDVYDDILRINLNQTIWAQTSLAGFEGQWLHVAGVWESGAVRIYLNGRLREQVPGFNGPIQPSEYALKIGRMANMSEGTTFNGMIDEVSVWKTALDSNMVRKSMQTPLRGDEPGLLGLWHLDEPAGYTSYDASPAATNGMLMNGAYIEASGAMKPETPIGLYAGVMDNAVHLNWVPNKEWDLSHYVLYRSLTSGFIPTDADSFARINHPNNSFIDTAVNLSQYYFYRVAAVDSAGNKSGVSLIVSALLDPPQINVQPIAVNFGLVPAHGLAFMPVRVRNTGIGELRIYQIHFLHGNRSYAVIDTIGEFTPPDLNIAGGDSLVFMVECHPTYASYFTDSLMIQSNDPDETDRLIYIPFTATSTLNEPPAQPQHLTIDPQNDRIVLAWQANMENDLYLYRIYRNTVDNPNTAARLDSALKPVTTYSDFAVTHGVDYHYWITAVDSAFRESIFSQPASTSINLAPVWTLPDTTYFAEDDSVQIDLYQLVSDDVDPDTSLILTALNGHSVTAKMLADNRHVVLRSPQNFFGSDRVVFRATDTGNRFSSDTSAISVKPVNDAPFIQNFIPDQIVPENATNFLVTDLSAVFSDVDNSQLSYMLLPTENFAASLQGSLLYISPKPNFNGTDTLGAEAVDAEGLIAIDYFKVTVSAANNPPLIAEIYDTTVYIYQPFFKQIAAKDIDGDTLHFTDNSPLFDIDPDSGRISFTPMAADTGQHTVTISVSDGTAAASESFLLRILPVEVSAAAELNINSLDQGFTLSWTNPSQTLYSGTKIFAGLTAGVPVPAGTGAALDSVFSTSGIARFTLRHLEIGEHYFIYIFNYYRFGSELLYSAPLGGEASTLAPLVNCDLAPRYHELTLRDTLHSIVRVKNDGGGTLICRFAYSPDSLQARWFQMDSLDHMISPYDSADISVTMHPYRGMAEATHRIAAYLEAKLPDWESPELTFYLTPLYDHEAPLLTAMAQFPDSVVSSAAVRFHYFADDLSGRKAGDPPELLRARYECDNLDIPGDTLRQQNIAGGDMMVFPLSDARYHFSLWIYDSEMNGYNSPPVYTAFFRVQARQTPLLANRWQMLAFPDQTPVNWMGLFPDSIHSPLYRWDNDLQDYRALKTIDPGAGLAFWIYPFKSFNIDIARLASAAASTAVHIPLHKGWNQIGAPAAFTINWLDAQFQGSSGTYSLTQAAENNLIQPALHWFKADSGLSKTNYIDAGSVMLEGRPWRGYWLYAKETGQLNILPVPAFEQPRSGLGKKARNLANEQEWQIALTLQSRGGRDEDNIFGCSDVVGSPVSEPPQMGNSGVLYFRNGADMLTRQLQQPLRDEEDVREWQVIIESRQTGSEHILTWQNPQNIPKFVYLVDPQNQEPVKLSATDNYRFTPHQKTSAFKIFATNNAGFKPPLIPENFALAQNYPNPFNPRTVIRFGVPLSGAEQPTTIRIYNVLGQEVVTLISGILDAGYHTVEWNGLNNRHQQAASGLYFCELHNGGKRLIKKMMLIR